MTERFKERYQANVGEVRCQNPEGIGKFAVNFVVRPPIEFASEEAREELSNHLLATIEVLGGHNLQPSSGGSAFMYPTASFTHRLPDGSGTVGNFTGFTNEGAIKSSTVEAALDIVLNGQGT